VALQNTKKEIIKCHEYSWFNRNTEEQSKMRNVFCFFAKIVDKQLRNKKES
jgi:hypothetical protein